MKFSDIHAHFVYGMDDGAQTQSDMEAMLDAAWRDDVAKLIATPHITPGIQPFDNERFRRRLNEARSYCRRRGYAMELCAGAEVLYTPALAYYVRENPLPALDNSQRVLIEFANAISYAEIASAVTLLEEHGYIPVIAHVERYRALAGFNAYRLKKHSGALYQVNGHTLINKNGFFRDQWIHRWFCDQLIDFVASDCHSCNVRKTCMKSAYAVLVKRYGVAYADRLTGRF